MKWLFNPVTLEYCWTLKLEDIAKVNFVENLTLNCEGDFGSIFYPWGTILD